MILIRLLQIHSVIGLICRFERQRKRYALTSLLPAHQIPFRVRIPLAGHPKINAKNHVSKESTTNLKTNMKEYLMN